MVSPAEARTDRVDEPEGPEAEPPNSDQRTEEGS